MDYYDLGEEENVLYETIVKYKRHSNIKLVLTDNVLLFEKKKLFCKNYKIYDFINIDSIESVKGIDLNKKNITLKTVDGEFKITFKSKSESKKFYKMLVELKKNANPVYRVMKAVRKVGSAVLGLAASFMALYRYKDELVKLANDVVDSLRS